MKELNYIIDENGNYQLREGHEQLTHGEAIGKELAIAYSAPTEPGSMWTLHKHGSPQKVRSWAEDAKAKLSATGGLGIEMANEIQVIQGTLSIHDVNKAISTSGYIRSLVKNHQAIDVDANVIDAEARVIDVEEKLADSSKNNDADENAQPKRRLGFRK